MARSFPYLAPCEPGKIRHSRHAASLPEEKLAKKRASDRAAQRQSRNKTKSYIATLESRIEALTRARDSGDAREWIDKIEEQRRENEELRESLSSIRRIIGTAEAGQSSRTPFAELKSNISFVHDEQSSGFSAHPEHVGNGQSNANDGFADGIVSPAAIDADLNVGAVTPSCEFADDIYPEADSAGDGMELMFELSPPNDYENTQFLDFQQINPPIFSSLLPDPEFACTQCKCSKILNFSNLILGRCSKLQLPDHTTQRLRDADIPIRAILQGWNAVTRKYLLDPLWCALRHADEVLLSKCGNIERLVVLHLLCLMLRSRVNPSKENLKAIPTYLEERPCQTFIPHEPYVDFFVWPGLRERIIFSPHKYCSEKYSHLFWKCFRFTWGSEFEEAYSKDETSGVYSFTDIFRQNVTRLSCFSMTPEFLDEFPELRSDITSTNSISID